MSRRRRSRRKNGASNAKPINKEIMRARVRKRPEVCIHAPINLINSSRPSRHASRLRATSDFAITRRGLHAGSFTDSARCSARSRTTPTHPALGVARAPAHVSKDRLSFTPFQSPMKPVDRGIPPTTGITDAIGSAIRDDAIKTEYISREIFLRRNTFRRSERTIGEIRARYLREIVQIPQNAATR